MTSYPPAQLSGAIETSYCRGCRRETRWIRSGGQNGSRPVATYWRCETCRIERVALSNVTDVQALARNIVTERRRSAQRDEETARLDFEDATGSVVEAIYAAYVEWDPARNASFLSWATFKGRCALTDWYRETFGRDTPKALSWALSIEGESNDDEEDGDYLGRLIEAPAGLAEGSITHALVVVEDEETRSTLREIVFPITLGYSHAEVAELHGQTEAWVSARLRKLRLREDLRARA